MSNQQTHLAGHLADQNCRLLARIVQITAQGPWTDDELSEVVDVLVLLSRGATQREIADLLATTRWRVRSVELQARAAILQKPRMRRELRADAAA